MYTVHKLDVRWEGEDAESPIHNYEVGVAETSSQEAAPDLLSYHSTGTIEQFISHHVNTMKMFYMFIRAINRAMLETTITLGPFIVDTTAPVYDNSVISVTLQEVFILGKWSSTAFQHSDEPQLLAYEVALGTDKCLEDVIAFQYITVVAACTGFWIDCVCAGLDTRQLGDFLHSDHTYYLTVRASNGAGLFATGSSDDFTHVAEFPDIGVVIEINPESTHIDTADFKQIDDADIACRWNGFEHPHVEVTYMVALGTAPGTINNITAFISTGQHTSYKFINLSLTE
ncbi:hypothetical protein LOD99_10451 [Oopsacas minuta]|uniref:Uncharacterized protein n=1 Tax=Oopsacas minuta TaxID=111878 RepID=A0AAV7KH60_9METZ|nr:hypothetical protein LOD99_10451 [Oopsacas minuta]